MKKHLFVFLCIAVICGNLASCNIHVDDQSVGNAEGIEDVHQSPTVLPQSEEDYYEGNDDASASDEWYSAILDEYSELELKIRALTDEEIRQVFTTGKAITVFGEKYAGNAIFLALHDMNIRDSRNYPLIYALHDINDDGSPELLMGMDHGHKIDILRIYTLQNEQPSPVIQQEWRDWLSLRLDDIGRCIIYYGWGRENYGEEYFYILDDNGELVILDILYRNGFIFNSSTDENYIGVYKAKDVNGEMVSITEDEYLRLFQKHAAKRLDDLEWNLVLNHARDN